MRPGHGPLGHLPIRLQRLQNNLELLLRRPIPTIFRFTHDGSSGDSDDRIDAALAAWLDYQKTQNTPYTHRTYRSIVSVFRMFLATRPAIKRLPAITTEVMLAFRQWALDQGNDRVTVDNRLIALRSFFNWCKATSRITANPVAQQRYGFPAISKLVDDVHAVFLGPLLDKLLLDGNGVLLPVPCGVAIVRHSAEPRRRRRRDRFLFDPPGTLVSI